MNPVLKKYLSQEWYTQSCPGRPIFMIGVGGLPVMQKTMGYSYHAILATYEEDYCEWKYPQKDLDAIANRIFSELKKDPSYLQALRRVYDRQVADQEPVFAAAESDLTKLPDDALIDLSKRHWVSRGVTVGSSHVIESLALALEHRMRHELFKGVTGTQSNEDFSALTTPLSHSFVSQKEELLWQIKNAGAKEKKALIQRFLKDFFWSETSYAGSEVLSESDVEKMADGLESFSKPDLSEIRHKKEALMARYGFSDAQRQWVEWTDFVTQWQDERKKATLFTAHYCTLLLDEISRRVGISSNLLKYLSPREVSEIFTDTPPASALEARKTGAVFYWDESGHEARVGEEVKKIREELFGNRKLDDVQDFRGMTASLGKVQGHVRILKSVKEINSIKKGEILVAVMTRPDYVPAMKKAAAIITDEGGITSHAAIVSRELKIPCIIGTKIATHVLKDGDLVEVNANHGSVKIISRVAR